jgi:hypothetical protein
MPYRCFWLEPTARERRYLRRFTWTGDGKCPNRPDWGHDAQAQIEDAPISQSPDGNVIGDMWPHDDPRWPTHCACGYEFKESDQWQLFRQTIYIRQDTGEETTLRDAPVGAMYDAPWLHTMHRYRCIDGQTLIIKLPDGGEWVIDGESISGGYWERTGKPPVITARPSILSSRYHGWLTAGLLSDDLEGRHYD